MPFSVALSDASGNIVSGTIAQLLIGPSYVEYPPRFENTIKDSKDGNIIVQTPVRDTRPRRWIWNNYKTSVPKYNALYSQILQLHYKLRLAAGQSPWVYIRDTETLNLNYLNYDGTNWVTIQGFLRAKVIQVSQNILQQSGYPSYQTIMEFYVDDPRYSDF